jgi:hypothetical protein
MATNDGYSPYATGMSAKQAVQALWNAYNINTNYSKVISQNTAPSYSDVPNDCSYWYNTSTNKLYRGVRNDELVLIMWFEV